MTETNKPGRKRKPKAKRFNLYVAAEDRPLVAFGLDRAKEQGQSASDVFVHATKQLAAKRTGKRPKTIAS